MPELQRLTQQLLDARLKYENALQAGKSLKELTALKEQIHILDTKVDES